MKKLVLVTCITLISGQVHALTSTQHNQIRKLIRNLEAGEITTQDQLNKAYQNINLKSIDLQNPLVKTQLIPLTKKFVVAKGSTSDTTNFGSEELDDVLDEMLLLKLSREELIALKQERTEKLVQFHNKLNPITKEAKKEKDIDTFLKTYIGGENSPHNKAADTFSIKERHWTYKVKSEAGKEFLNPFEALVVTHVMDALYTQTASFFDLLKSKNSITQEDKDLWDNLWGTIINWTTNENYRIDQNYTREEGTKTLEKEIEAFTNLDPNPSDTIGMKTMTEPLLSEKYEGVYKDFIEFVKDKTDYDLFDVSITIKTLFEKYNVEDPNDKATMTNTFKLISFITYLNYIVQQTDVDEEKIKTIKKLEEKIKQYPNTKDFYDTKYLVILKGTGTFLLDKNVLKGFYQTIHSRLTENEKKKITNPSDL